MSELHSEDIKESVIKRLVELFPNTWVYKEATSYPSYPSFFVRQIEVIDVEERQNVHILTYVMLVRYMVASDPSTNLKIEQNLDEVGLKLLRNFNTIEFDNDKIKCINKRLNKTDDMLNFLFDIDVMVKADDNIRYPKIDNLEMEVNYK